LVLPEEAIGVTVAASVEDVATEGVAPGAKARARGIVAQWRVLEESLLVGDVHVDEECAVEWEDAVAIVCIFMAAKVGAGVGAHHEGRLAEHQMAV